MRDFLLFTLYAPLGAFGDIAVGERRPGFDRPGRSAVLGLLGAALGLERHEEAELAALDESWALALRVERPGTLLQDYHTVQARSAERGREWQTRREALAERSTLETLLSLRDYRCDPFVTIALVARSEAGGGAEALARAMAAPGFLLYLGRKACPLGLPPRPQAHRAGLLAEAFAAYDEARPEPERAIRAALRLDRPAPRLYLDPELEPLLAPAYRVERIERRRDAPVSRRRWQFALRDELVACPAEAEAVA